MTLNERLKEIEARLEAATPGPWRTVRNNAMGETWFNIFSRNDDNVLAMISDLADEVKVWPDAELIAHAPTDIALLLAVVKELRAALDGIANIQNLDWPDRIYAAQAIARQALKRCEEMG